MNIYREQDSNRLRTALLMIVFFVFIIGLGWVFSIVYNAPEILFFAVIFSIAMNIVSYWYSDKIVLSLYKAIPVTEDSHPILYNITENLSITAGIPMPKLYVIPDDSPNAFATGRNKEHAAVAVTEGLLRIMERTELEGVIAHELSHIGNRDILLQTVVVVLVGFVSLLSDFFLRMHIYGGRRDNDNKGGGYLVLIGIVLAILSPIVAVIIQLAISRKREYLADATGALLTRYPEGLASALEKLGQAKVPLNKANNATAHMFISNPFGGKAYKGLSKLFMTHPPIEDRIAKLRGSI